MSAHLTMELAYLPDGRFHGAVTYRVNYLPIGQRATIESQNIAGTRWKVERWFESEGFRYMGEYPSAERALAALQSEVEAEAVKDELLVEFLVGLGNTFLNLKTALRQVAEFEHIVCANGRIMRIRDGNLAHVSFDESGVPRGWVRGPAPVHDWLNKLRQC